MPISNIAKHNQDLLALSDEVKHSKEYRALHEYVHNKSENVSHAQDKFCEAIEERFMTKQDPDEIESLLWKNWSVVTGLAANASGNIAQQERLVNFVLGLQTRPVLQKGDTVCKVWDAVVWSDLPILGAQIREVYNFEPTQEHGTGAQGHWTNLNTFLALLVETAQSKKVAKVDFSLYAIWALRQALEQGDKPEEVSIEVATIWLRYAASAIYALSQQNKTFDGKVAAPGSRFADKAWTGFSKDRWRAWDSRLDELQNKSLGKHYEDRITAARQAMGEYLER